MSVSSTSRCMQNIHFKRRACKKSYDLAALTSRGSNGDFDSPDALSSFVRGIVGWLDGVVIF